MNRIWEIDFVRAIAIVLMIVFHLIVDLRDFFNYQISYLTGFWYYIGKMAAILFMITAGLSVPLSSSALRHGVVVFSWGMLLTIVTYLFNPAMYIRFGILHFLGISLLTWPLISGLRISTLAGLSLTIIGLSHWVTTVTLTTWLLLPLGFTYQGFTSMDYYPLLPWYGVFLIGIILRKLLYKEKSSLFPAPGKAALSFSHIGRYSLIIYLTHQPVLLALLYGLH